MNLRFMMNLACKLHMPARFLNVRVVQVAYSVQDLIGQAIGQERKKEALPTLLFPWMNRPLLDLLASPQVKTTITCCDALVKLLRSHNMNRSGDRRFTLRHEADCYGRGQLRKRQWSYLSMTFFNIFFFALLFPYLRPPSGSILVSKTDPQNAKIASNSRAGWHTRGFFAELVSFF